MKPRVAVLDDERSMLEAIELVLSPQWEVVTFTDPEEALATLAAEPFEVLLTDLKMPRLSGLEVLRRARLGDPELPVVLLTAHASVPTAVSAMRQGAFDYIEKPFDNGALRALVARAAELSRLKRDNRYLRAELGGRRRFDPKTSIEGVVAESEGMRRVLRLARRVARSRSTVLITGESGTGKEVVARALHYLSDRVDGPFVAINAKALAEGVLEAELFGHEKGAFTGAHRSRPGIFERAHRGTLFLDEIGEITPEFQAKLLRVIEERQVQRVGGAAPVAVDVRLVAATNRDLDAEVAAGRFREDLYFRLRVVPIHIPPLRQRPEDVLPLADLFLERLSAEGDRPVRGFSEGAAESLREHAWPGNVRELENAVERGYLLADGEQIDAEDLLLEVPASGHGARTLREVMDAAAREHIRSVLESTGGSRRAAAERLDIERTTLYRWMRRLGLGMVE